VRGDTVGVPTPGVEVRIGDNGEVYYKSPGTFVEYYKNPESTAETKIQRAGLRLVMLAFLKKIPGTCVLLIGLRTSLKCLMGQCLLPNMLKIN
jgi:long-chain acyl-CoA synthetase